MGFRLARLLGLLIPPCTGVKEVIKTDRYGLKHPILQEMLDQGG